MVKKAGLPIGIPHTSAFEGLRKALFHQSHEIPEWRFSRKLYEEVQIIRHEKVATDQEIAGSVSSRVFHKHLFGILKRQWMSAFGDAAGYKIKRWFIAWKNALQPGWLAREFRSSHLWQ